MATTDQNCFVVKLQTSHETSEFSPEKKLENLTGDIDATIIKQIENYLLFNTSFLVKYQLLVHWKYFLQIVSRRRATRFNDKFA